MTTPASINNGHPVTQSVGMTSGGSAPSAAPARMKGEGANSSLGTFGVCISSPSVCVTYELLQVKSGLAQMLKVKWTFTFNFEAEGLRPFQGGVIMDVVNAEQVGLIFTSAKF